MSEIDEIKQRLPIEQLVGSYVPLKRAGRIFKGRCPFHQEKTPSFTVSPDRGIFKCFGCGKGGDIFDFVIEHEGLTFPEAVKLLADRAGVVLQEWKPSGPQPPKDAVGKDRIFGVNQFVANLWNRILLEHPKAEPARSYLTRRGLSAETIKTLQIGYAPYGNATAASLQKAGFTPKEIQAAGDPTKFQDRIVFPIGDLTGRVIGFTGRLLELPDDPRSAASRGPKYWNTPETAVFIKSRALYNLHNAKHAMQKEGYALLAEGQMDVSMLFQHGYQTAVASSGTALTTEQLNLIGRFTDNVVFAYDQDSAGIEAVKRGLELALAAELNPYVAVVPNGKDPADCLLNDPESWKQALEGRKAFMDWLIGQYVPAGELTPVAKKDAAKALIPWLNRIKDPIEQSEWRRKTAARLQTDEENIIAAMERTPNRAPSNRRADEPAAQAPHPSSPAKNDPIIQQAELVAALILAFPDTRPHATDALRTLEGMQSPYLEKALPVLATENLREALHEESSKQLLVDSEERLAPYQDAELTDAKALEEILFLAQRLRSDRKEVIKADLAAKIAQAQAAGDSERVKALFGQLREAL